MQGFVQTPPGEAPSRGHLRTIATLVRYLWPAGRGDLKVRVIAAGVLIVLAKLANVSVPFFYKEAVDALVDNGRHERR